MRRAGVAVDARLLERVFELHAGVRLHRAPDVGVLERDLVGPPVRTQRTVVPVDTRAAGGEKVNSLSPSAEPTVTTGEG